jgi:hypothetical protein
MSRKLGLGILGAAVLVGVGFVSGAAAAAPIPSGPGAAPAALSADAMIEQARWKGGREWGRSHNRGRHLGWTKGKHRGWR